MCRDVYKFIAKIIIAVLLLGEDYFIIFVVDIVVLKVLVLSLLTPSSKVKNELHI